MPMLELDAELERVLWACREGAIRFPTPDGSICFEWLRPIFRQEFKSDFHQSKLGLLAKRGLLRENDSTRNGKRRYYTLATSAVDAVI